MRQHYVIIVIIIIIIGNYPTVNACYTPSLAIYKGAPELLVSK